ncbi:MAG: ribonuclease P protein component [Myxococcota bacterium]
MPGGERFPKSARLRNRREFLHVQQSGTKVDAGCLLALAVPNERPFTRVGFTVSSKVGNAVVRNQIRRRLRELFRKRAALLPVGVDVVFIAKSSAAQADFATLARAFDTAAAKLSRQFA